MKICQPFEIHYYPRLTIAEREEQALESDMELYSPEALISFYSNKIPHEFISDKNRLIYTRMLIRIHIKKIMRDHCE